MTEVYLSIDVETDGPIPGPHSMLSFGTAAFTLEGGHISSFSANLETIPGATMDPVTKREFWDRQPEAWAACRKDLRDPAEALTAYTTWVQQLPGKPVCVGYPVTFDHMFLYWYLIRFTGSSPFSFSGLDIKSYAMAVLKLHSFREATKRNMPKRWFSDVRHTHVAIDDAIEQGWVFLNALRENLASR